MTEMEAHDLGACLGYGECDRCDRERTRRALAAAKPKRETERCDTCGEKVGYYDPALPEGEKIIITRDCECVRRDRADRAARS